MTKFAHGKFLAQRSLLMAGILVAGCGVFCAQTNGQDRGGMHQRGGGVERELNELTQALSLTPDQQAQVKTLLQDQRQQMQALRNSAASSDTADGSQPNLHERMQAIHKDTNTKIEALLNDDQKTKFTAWQQQQMQKRHGQEGGGNESAPPSQPNSNE